MPVTRVTPSEGQLPSPAWSGLSRFPPGLRQHLGCGQLPPPRPAAPPCRPSPALVPSSPPSVGKTGSSYSLSPRPQQDHRPALSPPPPPPLPPSWPAAARACALARGGGAHTLAGHALPRPRKNPEWARSLQAQIRGGGSLANVSCCGLDGRGRDRRRSGAFSNSLQRTPSKSNTCRSFPHSSHWNAVPAQAAMT